MTKSKSLKKNDDEQILYEVGDVTDFLIYFNDTLHNSLQPNAQYSVTSYVITSIIILFCLHPQFPGNLPLLSRAHEPRNIWIWGGAVTINAQRARRYTSDTGEL